MARPKTKSELQEAAVTQFNKLNSLIESMSVDEKTTPFGFDDRDKNLRDVLAHLYAWQQMMEKWYLVGVIEKGIPIIPAEGYTWKTTADLNHGLWEEYQEVSLDEIHSLLDQSHQRLLAMIDTHSNDELFSRKVYPWTKTTTLGAYFIGATSSHYDWAMKKIRKHIRLSRAK